MIRPLCTEHLADQRGVGVLPIRCQVGPVMGQRMPSPGHERPANRWTGSVQTSPCHGLELLSPLLVRLGEASSGPHGRRVDMDHVVAAPLDEDRDRHRAEPPIRFVGLELVHHHGASQTAALAEMTPELGCVKATAVDPEEVEAVFDRLAVDTENLTDLPKRGLCTQQVRDLLVDPRLAKAAIQAEGLGGEGSSATAAEEPRDAARVAATPIGPLSDEPPLGRQVMRQAGCIGTERWTKPHESYRVAGMENPPVDAMRRARLRRGSHSVPTYLGQIPVKKEDRLLSLPPLNTR